jgi:hypothetical protein
MNHGPKTPNKIKDCRWIASASRASAPPTLAERGLKELAREPARPDPGGRVPALGHRPSSKRREDAARIAIVYGGQDGMALSIL